DLTKDIVEETGFSLDEAGFHEEMETQRQRARASWKGSEEKKVDPVVKSLAAELTTDFAGYERTELETKVAALVQGDKRVDEVPAGEEVLVVLDATPFYAESGGQVGDTGALEWPGGTATVLNTLNPAEGLILHKCRVDQGALEAGSVVQARVDAERRSATAFNHTATHVLHAVLRQVLGDHVKQAGSLVAPDRLRFDFTHFAPLNSRELERIESLSNDWIWRNVPVETAVKPLEEAISDGAMALFGEKYGDRVRMVQIPELSKELCGGTHVHATGDIGLVKVTHEGGIAAGVRRIEAVTGRSAYEYLKGFEREVLTLAEMVKGSPGQIAPKVEKVLREKKDLLQELGSLKREMADLRGGDVAEQVREVAGIKVLSQRMDRLSPEELRAYADKLKDRIQSGVVVAGSAHDGKIAFVAMVTADLTDRVHAGKLVKAVAQLTGGGGGGRPDMAQAGGKDLAKLDDALAQVADLVGGQAAKG
ncbi:MAG: alanine--tRNA ligase-related protein, partial [bacterium]|nr:alanine--tRNA ligase-related protein [bacterium]